MVFQTIPKKYSFWRGNNICISRLKQNFWNLEFSSTNTSCPSNTKQCGYLDTFKNFLCVNKDVICPITNLDILSQNDRPSYTAYTKIPLNNNYNLYFSNANNAKPIITNIIPSQNKVCALPNEGALNENTYILNNEKGPSSCQTTINNTLFDNRFTYLDSDVLNNFYSYNGIDILISKLPNYPQPSPTDSAHLYQVNYFGWDRKCYNEPIFFLFKLFNLA